jgi:hypothetical protein
MGNTKKDSVQSSNEEIVRLMKEKEILDKKSEELAKKIRKLVYDS